MREIFARGSQIESGEFLLVEARFRNAGNFCLWKPDRIREIFACGSQIESGEFLLVEALVSGFQPIRYSDPTNDWNLQYALLSRNPESSTWSPKSTAWNPDSETVMRRNQRHCFREP